MSSRYIHSLINSSPVGLKKLLCVWKEPDNDTQDYYINSIISTHDFKVVYKWIDGPIKKKQNTFIHLAIQTKCSIKVFWPKKHTQFCKSRGFLQKLVDLSFVVIWCLANSHYWPPKRKITMNSVVSTCCTMFRKLRVQHFDRL